MQSLDGDVDIDTHLTLIYLTQIQFGVSDPISLYIYTIVINIFITNLFDIHSKRRCCCAHWQIVELYYKNVLL